MALTDTDLANYALSIVGGGGEDVGSFKITSIGGSSGTPRLCTDRLPRVREEVLCRAWWAEATKYADLDDELSDKVKADWEYAFDLPDDYCGRCKQIDEDYHRSTKARYTHEYDKEVVQGMLFTNEYSNSDGDSAYIKYIFKLTDVTKFSPLLYKAVAVMLAAELSVVLLVDKGRRRIELLQEFEQLILPIAEGETAEQQGDDEDKGEYATLNARMP